MEVYFNSPAEVVEANIKGAQGKASLPAWKMILLGMLAGVFIALGGAASSTAVHGIADVGLARTVSGMIFPVGLMMVILLGGELFTGNCLMVMAVLDRRVTWGRLLRNLVIVYLSNLAGAVLTALLLNLSGNLNYSGGLLGAYTIKTAAAKAGIAPLQGIASGMLCNLLVCTAILMAAAARETAGKIWAVFFPIAAFVIGGFEHCVANMFYIPAGMLASLNPEYAARAQEAYGITAEQLGALNGWNGVCSILFVTLGNVIGGMALVGVPLFLVHRYNRSQAQIPM